MVPNEPIGERFLLLRWLIIILASYVTLFENIEDAGIVGLFLIVVAFVLSNVLIGLAPIEIVMTAKRRHIIAAVDAVFICTFLYYLRVDQAPIHIPFMGIVVLAIIWPDLRVVLFAMFVVSLLFGLFTNFELFGATIEIARDDFLTLSLLFIVAIFYIFMVERFDRDTETSTALLREKRHSEKATEITRQISASLKAKEILAVLIKRFRELMPDVDCSIVRAEADRSEARVIAGSRPDGSPGMILDEIPTLGEAFTLKETSYATIKRNGGKVTTMAVPMISRGEVVAALYFEHESNPTNPLEENRGFIEVIASAAASSLSNAEQFEALRELATSESATKLANHGTFQNPACARGRNGIAAQPRGLASDGRSGLAEEDQREARLSCWRQRDRSGCRSHPNRLPRQGFSSTLRRRGIHRHSSRNRPQGSCAVRRGTPPASRKRSIGLTPRSPCRLGSPVVPSMP